MSEHVKDVIGNILITISIVGMLLISTIFW